MLTQIRGLHHITSLASSPAGNNAFFTGTLGLRRVKKTVNFDRPEVYHLYYGDEVGTPGTVMTYFPNPEARPGRPGAGEVGRSAFSVAHDSLDAWADRLAASGVQGLGRDRRFGEDRLLFLGPDGDAFALVGTRDDPRVPWAGGGIGAGMGLRGFHSAEMRLRDGGASAELLGFMGYEQTGREGNVTRYALPGGNRADVIDIETLPGAEPAAQGAGSVHHIAFAVENRARQLEVREALVDAGHSVTPVIDRNYFWAIYFRPPGGVLFEVSTNEPGFAADEDTAHLGMALKLPPQHAHLRERLERTLEPIG